jgi:hypothetical protein
MASLTCIKPTPTIHRPKELSAMLTLANYGKLRLPEAFLASMPVALFSATASR